LLLAEKEEKMRQAISPEKAVVKIFMMARGVAM
jgi:hypothetical protein